MPYDPLGRDDLPPARLRKLAVQRGRRLVLLGVVFLIAPFMIAFFVTGGASLSYTDEKGNLHAPMLKDKEEREAVRQNPPPGSPARLAAPTGPDYLIYLSVGTGVVLMACGLFEMVPRR